MTLTDRIVISALTEDEQDWFDVLWARLHARRNGNILRASYYDCHRAEQALATIAPHYRGLGAVLGWNAKSVDMLVRRCNPEGFYWPDGELDDLGMSELVESNNLYAEIKSGLVESAVQGVSFVVTTQGDDSKDEPAALVHVKDALNATGEWNPRRRRLDAALSVTGWTQDSRKPSSFVLYLDDVTVSVEADASGKWVADRTSHQWGVPVEPLVYRPRTGRLFGSPRITRPQMFLQDSAVRALLRMEGHMDVYATPQMWLLGADDSIFKNADGTQKASWQIALGRVFGVPDDEDADPQNARADVKQFAAQSPEPHLAQLSALAKLFAREASLPDAALAITDMANPTSADAYVAANDDLIAEAEGATDDWSLPIRRFVARALAIQNDEPIRDDLLSLDVHWRSPVHISKAAAADAGAKQIASVPWLAETEVGLELLGLSGDQIKRALADRRRQRGSGVLEAIRSRAGVTTTDAVDPGAA